jgi:hypothetical protein
VVPQRRAVVTYVYYNMKDPVWGGYTPEKVALRRSVGLAYDIQAEINVVRNGTAIEAVSPIPPGVLGYDANFNLGVPTIPPRPRRCSTCSVMSTRTATAGATCRTADR